MIYLNGKLAKAYWGGHWHKAAYLGSQLVWQNTVQREAAGDAKITLAAEAEATAADPAPLGTETDGRLLADARAMSAAAEGSSIATEKLGSPYNAGLRIGKVLLSDEECIALDIAAKSVVSAADGLQAEAAASMTHKGKAYAQRLLKPATGTVDTQCRAKGAAIASKRVKTAAPATVKYKGKAYAQKLLKPALLAAKIQQAAEASSLPARTAASDRNTEIKHRGKAYAQRLLKPATLAQTAAVLAQGNALPSALAGSDTTAQFYIRAKMHPPAAKRAAAALQTEEKLHAQPRGQPSAPSKGTESLSQRAAVRASPQPPAPVKASGSAKSGAAALPDIMTEYTGKLQGSAVTEAAAAVRSADAAVPTVGADMQARHSAALYAVDAASLWVAPVQTGTRLKITSAYEATQTGSKLVIR